MGLIQGEHPEEVAYVKNNALYTQLRTSDGSEIAVDSVTNSLETIDYPHHETHAGNHYYIEGYVELNTDDVFRIKLVTPDTTKWAHFSWSIVSSGICETTLHENASGGMTGGSSVTPINNNRNSSNTSGLTITSGVTDADTVGTQVSSAKWGSTGFKAMVGGESSRENEIILKQNTTYLRTITSGEDNNIIQFRASWYEHTNKN